MRSRERARRVPPKDREEVVGERQRLVPRVTQLVERAIERFAHERGDGGRDVGAFGESLDVGLECCRQCIEMALNPRGHDLVVDPRCEAGSAPKAHGGDGICFRSR